MQMIELKNVSKSFGENSVLSGISFAFPDSGITCIEGKSGKGKTTLLRILAGLEKPDSGSVEGIESKKISYVFQEDRLLPAVTAFENVSLVSNEKSAGFWMNELEILEHGGKLPGELSGGMRRRVAIARALAFGGDVYLFDEPFKGLDEALKEKLKKIIKNLSKTACVLLVVHNYDEKIICDSCLSI